MAFGIAIGYASNFAPAEKLWALAIGLTGCAIAYSVVACCQRSLQHFQDYGLQTLLLVLAAIAPMTPKLWSARWTIVFVSLGCIGMILNLTHKDLPTHAR